MLDAHKISDALFKFLHIWTIIGQPAIVQDLAHALFKPLAIADVWATDMQGFRKCARAAEGSQFIDLGLSWLRISLDGGRHFKWSWLDYWRRTNSRSRSSYFFWLYQTPRF